MTHSEVCPVCKGTGEVISSGYSNSATIGVCHSCGGAGWIVVYDEQYNVQDLVLFDRVNTLESTLRELIKKVENLEGKLNEE